MAALLDLRKPGVYTIEVPTLPPTVAIVQSAVPVFIGRTERAVRKGKDLSGKAIRIKSMKEYEDWFGGAKQVKLEVSIDESVAGQPPLVTIDKVEEEKERMHYALQLYYANGGGPCYIYSVGEYSGVEEAIEEEDEVEEGDVEEGEVEEEDGEVENPYQIANGLEKALKLAKDITILVFTDHIEPSQYGTVISSALMHCEKMKNRVTIIDMENGNEVQNTVEQDALDFQGKLPTGTGLEKYGMVYYPFLETGLSYQYDDGEVTIKTHEQPETDDEEAEAPENHANKTLDKLAPTKDNNGKYDKLYNAIRAAIRSYPVTMPPSAAVAGIYVRTDATQGPWTAPANTSVFGVIEPSVELDDDDHAVLNAPDNGKAINAIRAYPGKGTLVYGARTLMANSLEWRYISVTRTFGFIEDTIARSMQDFVFKANTQETWIKVRAMINAFLNQIWKAGGLYGATPEDAYQVLVGEPDTMSVEDVLGGIMRVVIKIAVARPAEFIILQYEHKFELTES